MWTILEKFTEQVTKYSTVFGQLWYLIVFVFRLIVVVTLGSAVYGDEQSNFKCSTTSGGCPNACFDAFTRVSHLRFWSFQLLALSAPVAVFHFYTTYMSGQIEKLRVAEKEMEENNPETDPVKNQREMIKRTKIVGKVKTRQVYSKGVLQKVPITKSIHIAYYVTTILKCVTEAVFLYLGFTLYYNKDHTCFPNCAPVSPVAFIWMEFPSFFRCERFTNSISLACAQHFIGYRPGQGGSVPCWTSRAWEKTLFLRYMNILSAICFLLAALELIWVPVRAVWTSVSKSKRRYIDSRYAARRPANMQIADTHEYPGKMRHDMELSMSPQSSYVARNAIGDPVGSSSKNVPPYPIEEYRA
ncbi:gap junction beta-2 protein [Ciona intestinalis]